MEEAIGKAIKRLRRAKGWSLDDLAEESGIDRGTLNRIELGKQQPHRATLRSIVRGLNARPDQVTKDPHLLAGLGDAGGSESVGARIEDRLGDLLGYIKTLDGDQRREFIHAVIALLTALEHASPERRAVEPVGDITK